MIEELSPADIHVWTVSLADISAESSGFGELLSGDERERAARLKSASARRDFVTSRSCLRRILARYLDLSPDELRFSYASSGKPALAGKGGSHDLRFNLSHSGELLLIAVARCRDVGIDLEQVRHGIAFGAISSRFFSPREAAALDSLAPGLQLEAFYRCWTRKEAYAKGQGSGLALPFNRFSVSLLPGEPAALLEDEASPDEVARWRLIDLAVPAGYVATLAAAGGAPALYFRSGPQ